MLPGFMWHHPCATVAISFFETHSQTHTHTHTHTHTLIHEQNNQMVILLFALPYNYLLKYTWIYDNLKLQL